MMQSWTLPQLERILQAYVFEAETALRNGNLQRYDDYVALARAIKEIINFERWMLMQNNLAVRSRREEAETQH